MGLKINDIEDFTLWVSPFVSFASGGLLWDAKIRVNPLDMDPPAEMFELFFGIKTAF
jgi:hypothetical protein